MKDKIIIFIIGVLFGAIISTDRSMFMLKQLLIILVIIKECK